LHLNASAQPLLKSSMRVVGVVSFTGDNWWSMSWRIVTEAHFLGGFVCYAVSLVVWIMALSRVPVSVAYPMLSIGYVVNALAAWYLFGEALTFTRIFGIAVIIAGVYLITRS